MTKQDIPIGSEIDPIASRLALIARYADCFQRLARMAHQLGRRDLGRQLSEISGCLERMASELATEQSGTLVLRRAARVIGVAERIIDKEMRASVLH